MIKSLLLIGLFTFLLINNNFVTAQIECQPINSTFSFVPTPTSQNKIIDWDKFPEFSLPFTIVYNGPRFGDQKQQPLKHGFSHLSNYSGADSALVAPKNRALIYYGVAYNFGNPQPWQTLRSPWGNDIPSYWAKWRGELAAYAYHFMDTRGTRAPAADLFILDIERHWEGQFKLATDLSILAIKNDPQIPKAIAQLPDNLFIERYKRDMLNLYIEPLKFMKQDGLLDKFNKISSYGDVPIRFQGLNIEANQWTDWQTNPTRLSYLMQDTLTNKLGNGFYNQLDFLCPSAYVQADYATNPKARGGNYLAEILFQIEANKAWSNKPNIPFIWLRYEDFSLQYPRWVKPFQAEALAIFPFMAGASGAVLWEDSFNPTDINYTTYEYYINGLYKLSQYKTFFEGNPQFVLGENARDLYTKQVPVWRGVVKNDKILIAAQNPYAADNEITKLFVSQGKWSNTITLTGKEVFLCSFNLVDITANEAIENKYGFKLNQNPLVENNLNFNLKLPVDQPLQISIFDIAGKEIYNQEMVGQFGDNKYFIKMNSFAKGPFLLNIKIKEGYINRKILNY